MVVRSLKQSKNSGQAIVAILLILTLALIVATGISSRFISSLRTKVTSDYSYKADSVAQALAEKLLLTDFQTLKGYITNNNCGSNCTLTLNQGVAGSSATAALSHLGNSSNAFEVDASTDEASGVSLEGYGSNKNIDICWNNLTNGTKPSVIALFVFGTAGSYLADSYAYNANGSINTSNGFSSAVANFGYANCFTVTGKSSPRLLRLRSVYGDVKVYAKPVSGEVIPSQGVKITSVGTSGDAARTVVVSKSDTFLPVDF